MTHDEFESIAAHDAHRAASPQGGEGGAGLE